MDYLSIHDFTNKWNISKRRIQILCKEGRIPGAKMIGNMWVLPENTARPRDARKKYPISKICAKTHVLRKALKQTLKKLYYECSERTVMSETNKYYILSLIAGSLCSYFLGTSLSKEMYNTIYRDISGSSRVFDYKEKDIEIVFELIKNFSKDGDLPNLLSWSYQYLNKLTGETEFSKTQFFTEKYMIDYILKNIPELSKAEKILDPCVGGGNFLSECLEQLCLIKQPLTVETVLLNSRKLYGFDIDSSIARIAVANIRLRALQILRNNTIQPSFELWGQIKPNIYIAAEPEQIQGTLTKADPDIKDVIDGTVIHMKHFLSNADIVLTNPPFASIKGMKNKQKEFLKHDYPDSNCDTCVAFMEAIQKMLKKNGVCGIVTQNSWMHLKSFKAIRQWIITKYALRTIANLGSGAFQDLSGEKTNVSLVIFSNLYKEDNVINILNLGVTTCEEKMKILSSDSKYIKKKQSLINGVNGLDFSENDVFQSITSSSKKYKDIAVPMQGTSTGNAKKLVGYFWEHFNDDDWITVSNGGGYCRWEGLNNSVVKWGKNGEYIKAQKGSALRNVKYFSDTQIVYSDTGTAGLNVRLLLDKQIFIASGPGIRIVDGNKYAHMALLNSRLASYCIRLMSPKLTIAAGYIGQLPIKGNITSSIVLEKDARTCVDLKTRLLMTRPNNLEYKDYYLTMLPTTIQQAAWSLFNEDITNELMKLELEAKIDAYIFKQYGFSDDVKKSLDNVTGKCAYDIYSNNIIDFTKLDDYMVKLMDSSCTLKRTKTKKSALGSDGIIEYLSKDLNINPDVLVHEIQNEPYIFKKVLEKYQDLILHNYILHYMDYTVEHGVRKSPQKVKGLIQKLSGRFADTFDYEEWINNSFNQIHSEIFKNAPFVICKNEEIQAYDTSIKK